jgi:hypothetical protein
MKTTRWVALLLAVGTAGCGGGGKMEWKGTLKGESELVDYKAAMSSTYPPPAPLDKGNGSATLESGLDNLLRLGKDTTIPGCMLSFFPGSAKRDSTEKATAREFRLKDDSPIKRDGPGGAAGCVGRIDKDGPLVEIEIDHALVSLHNDGEFYVGIDYRAKGDYDKKRVLRIKGTRGWF